MSKTTAALLAIFVLAIDRVAKAASLSGMSFLHRDGGVVLGFVFYANNRFGYWHLIIPVALTSAFIVFRKHLPWDEIEAMNLHAGLAFSLTALTSQLVDIVLWGGGIDYFALFYRYGVLFNVADMAMLTGFAMTTASLLGALRRTAWAS